MIGGDQRKHHIHRPVAAAAGDDAVVRLEDVRRWRKVREVFKESGAVLPMHGEAPVFEQPGFRQHESAGADAANHAAAPSVAPDPGQRLLARQRFRRDAGADEEQSGAVNRPRTAGDDQFDTVGADRVSAILGKKMPPIEHLAGQLVDDPQGLDRRTESDHRQMRHQKKDDIAGLLIALKAERGSTFRNEAIEFGVEGHGVGLS